MHALENTSKIIQIIFIGSLLPALVGSLILAMLWPDYRPLLFVLIGFAFLGHFLTQYLARRGKSNDWLLSIAILNLLVLTPEVFLRLTAFHYETGILFGYPRSFQKFVPDEDLFWVLPADQSGVNSLGFRGDEIEVPKPADVCRILFLGDSVPVQGYPKVVEALLNQQQLKMRVESVSLALSGYSSYQGRVVVDKYGAMVAPDLVVVSYGWNDHWLAYGSIDSQKVMVVSDQSRIEKSFAATYSNLRLLQWLRYVFRPVLGAELPLAEVRVPLNEYVENLTYIGQFFAAGNSAVIFITPPTSHYALGVHDHLVEQQFATDKTSVTTLHQTYNQAVREVAAANDWLILDLEREFESLANPAEIFIDDGIHLTDRGVKMIGERIADTIIGKSCVLP